MSLIDQRTWVLNELLQTERRYVASLELILSVFLSSVEKIIAPRDLRLLFPCQLEPLIILHRDLLSRLTERIEVASRWQGVVGDVFGRICTDQEVHKKEILVYCVHSYTSFLILIAIVIMFGCLLSDCVFL